MSDKPAASGKAKSIFSNPLVLIGGGAAVLFLMLRSGDSSSSGASTDTTTAVDQALTDQQKAVNDALAQQNSDVQSQMDANAARLTDALNAQSANDPNAGPIKTLQGQVATLTAQLKALPKVAPTAPPSGVIFPTTVFDVSPNSPLAKLALTWSQATGVSYAEGLAYVQHFGREPSSIAELNLWRQTIGQIGTDGKWHVGTG